MLTASKVANNLNLQGYRIVNNNGNNAHSAYHPIHNLYLDIIGGQ